jgi:hypothetical protein
MEEIIHTVRLIQHSPIIHFKPEDIPIRATELKPAFDRFLIENVGDFKKFRKDQKKFKTLYKYKIEIYSINQKSDPIKKKTLYFGDTKKTKFVCADVEVKFFSFDAKLIETIKKFFPEFISQYNFGMRKNKGFGSFTTEDGFIKPKNRRVFYMDLDKEGWMEDLNYFYRSLRQGINENGFYLKPLIFEYACIKNMEWEKKRIKEKFDELNIKHPRARHQVNSCHFDECKIFRDVFGLSTSQNWMGYKKDECDVIIIKKEHMSYTDREKRSDKIERFPSPVFFKPVKSGDKMRVYFWINGPTVKGKFRIKAELKKTVYQNGKKRKIKCENEKYIDSLWVSDMDWDKFFEIMLERKSRFRSDSKNDIEQKLARTYGSLEELK